jgi:arsenate reductase (thioredoxin)
MVNKPVRLYFLCIQNRCRSQIAEAFAKHYGGEFIIAESAGIEASSIHPYTIEAMKEVGIDISGNSSKSINMKSLTSSNAVIKLCEEVNEKCPIVPFGIRNFQWNVPDPLKQGQSLEDVRKTRDEIREKVIELLRGYHIPINL